MRLKQTSALLLASAMLVGSVGIMNPTEVRAADATNTFTLTVPADTNITTSGWNDIGSVGVSNVSIAADKKISVTIGGGATGRALKKTGDASKTVGYEIKKGNATTSEAFGTSLDFTANGTQAIGADVASFAGKPAGNYTDTITFTATLKEKVTDFTMTNEGNKTLSTADLGAPSAFTVNGKTYYAYNAFISKTSGSNWQNAQEFVKMLNDNKYDGHTDWMLINDVDKTNNPYRSAIGKAWKDNYSSTDCGDVFFLWSSVVYNEDKAFYFFVDMDSCDNRSKDDYFDECGFLVLRGPSNASAAAPVTYDRTDGSGTLSSANLGEPTSWTYDNTTYQVYNEFIPFSSGSGWNDAVGFVNALKTASYGGHNDWTLLSSEAMARAYANNSTGAMPSARDGVDALWSSVENTGSTAYYLGCIYTDWETVLKSSADPVYGFVVLRAAPTAVTYNKKDSTGTLSSEYLGTATTWTYNGMTYDVYNGFIPHSLDTSWTDAMGFINALNTANYDGHNDWTLLSSQEMATAYAQNGTGVMPSDCGGVIFLWSSVPCDNSTLAYCLRCDDNVHWQYGGKSSSSGNGFVVLRGSSN